MSRLSEALAQRLRTGAAALGFGRPAPALEPWALADRAGEAAAIASPPPEAAVTEGPAAAGGDDAPAPLSFEPEPAPAEVSASVLDAPAPELQGPVRPLKHPWPYVSSISFSNDAEMLDWPIFLSVNRLFCGEGGLGIPLSNSLFIFPVRAQFDHSFGYYEGVSKAFSPLAPKIRELIASGHIDTIHAYGDFDHGGFHRRYAERALAELDRYGLRIPIYTNHGSDQNFQNVGCEALQVYQRGDDPSAPEYYHLDVSRALGVRYFWIDSALTLQFGGPLLVSQKARDGSELRVFNRFRGLMGYPAPNAGSLERQFNEDDLDDLEQRGDAVVIYQHFGVDRRNADGSFTKSEDPIFSEAGHALLRSVSQRVSEGRLWAAAAPMLLDYERLQTVVRPRLEGEDLVLAFPGEPFDPAASPPLSYRVAAPAVSRVFVEAAPGRRLRVAARIERLDDSEFVVVLHARPPPLFEMR